MCRISGGTRAVDSPITICITLHSWSTRGSNPLPAASCSQRTREGGTLPPKAPAFVRRLSDYRLQVHVILLVRRALLHSAPSSRCRLPALRAAALLSPSSCRAYARSGARADLL